MTNWNDPTLDRSIAHVVLWDVTFFSGLYVWEFVVTFEFDWECFTRKRPFRWTQVPYFGARYGPLWALINATYAMNVLSPSTHCTTIWRLIYVRCFVLVYSTLYRLVYKVGAHVSVISASLLLIVRVVAISEHNRIVAAALGSLWLGEVGTAFLNLALVKGRYAPELLACAVGNTIMTRPTILIAFGIHFACLVLTIWLLLRRRGAGLWRLLLSRGFIYFAVTLVAYIPTTVLLLLNFNGAPIVDVLTPQSYHVIRCNESKHSGAHK
ncbi:hypothetical protein AURDEDRAFT_174909 [Auricularia subglabra TFB-10046 SS5]|uniref:Uncharacterized protein n=1 Tax=Auricularia subglabra (strain TFB-10046 / SS5) TaxID=717982 RepID=J0CY11_AURST|nr:hypothetical protein AURDEDRAFT_174909 [Auricularia subglabra TFB-10046 SS5]